MGVTRAIYCELPWQPSCIRGVTSAHPGAGSEPFRSLLVTRGKRVTESLRLHGCLDAVLESLRLHGSIVAVRALLPVHSRCFA